MAEEMLTDDNASAALTLIPSAPGAWTGGSDEDEEEDEEEKKEEEDVEEGGTGGAGVEEGKGEDVVVEEELSAELVTEKSRLLEAINAAGWSAVAVMFEAAPARLRADKDLFGNPNLT
jgi:hypothetical protein